MVSPRARKLQERQHALLLTAASLSLLAALFGTYWDDAWHTDVGRDTFWTLPHLVLYAGIGGAGTLLVLHALLLARESGVRSVLARRTLLVGLLGALVTLASAPIDDAWHRSFGRDAVAWSPPHMLGLVGVLLMVTGIALELHRHDTPIARKTRVVPHAGIIAVLASLVFEYDSDVPQFRLLWYLPILTLATWLAYRLIRSMDDRPRAVLDAALLYTALMAGVVIFLVAIRASHPLVPVIAIPLFVSLAIETRLQNRYAAAMAYAASLALTYAAYTPFWGFQIPTLDLLMGAALTILAIVALEALTQLALAPRRTAAVLLVLLVTTAALPTALAHDPGQGEPLGSAKLTADAHGESITLDATLTSADCAAYAPDEIHARRAGSDLTAPLSPAGPCAYTGTIQVPEEGRWFLYVHLHNAQHDVEAWLPLVVGKGDAHASKTATLYAPPAKNPDKEWLAAAALYGVEVGLVALAVYAARPAPRVPTRG